MSFYLSYLLHQAWRNKVITLSLIFITCSWYYRDYGNNGPFVIGRAGQKMLFYDIDHTKGHIKLRTKNNNIVEVAIRGVTVPKLHQKAHTCETNLALRMHNEIYRSLSIAKNIVAINAVRQTGYVMADIEYDKKSLVKELRNKGLVHNDNRTQVSEKEWCNLYYRLPAH